MSAPTSELCCSAQVNSSRFKQAKNQLCQCITLFARCVSWCTAVPSLHAMSQMMHGHDALLLLCRGMTSGVLSILHRPSPAKTACSLWQASLECQGNWIKTASGLSCRTDLQMGWSWSGLMDMCCGAARTLQTSHCRQTSSHKQMHCCSMQGLAW